MNVTKTFLRENCQDFDKYQDFQTTFDSDIGFQKEFCSIVSESILCKKTDDITCFLLANGMPLNIEGIDILKTEIGLKDKTKAKEVDTKAKEVDTKAKEVDTKAKEVLQITNNIIVELKNSKYKDILKDQISILEECKNKPSSKEFKDATKAILSELKSQAQKSGDFTEYASFVKQFHSIGAVSPKEYAVFQREMSELTRESEKKSPDNKSDEFKLPEGFRESQNTKGVYTKFASLGEKFDEVVTIKDGKGSKDIISDRSGYSIHLDNVVDIGEQENITKESQLRTTLDTPKDLLKRTEEFIMNQEKQEKEGTDPEKVKQAKENREKAEEYKKKEIQPEIERIQKELDVIQKKIQGEQDAKK